MDYMNEFNQIYDTYLALMDRDYDPDFKYDKLKNVNDTKDQFFYFLLNFYGKNKRTQFFKDEYFDDVQGVTMFHGFRKAEHGANFLWDDVYHYGSGTLCLGFFTTNSYEEACDYSYYNSRMIDPLEMKISYENMIDMKILTRLCDALYKKEINKSKFRIDDEKLQKLCELKNFINSTNDKHFLRILTENPTSLAVVLGFDSVKMRVGSDTYIVVLNRGKISVCESDVKRFLRLAGNNYCDKEKLVVGGSNDYERT